jgi:hypothetical protein
MLEYLLLLLSLARSAVRDREALVAENLLRRHQLAVLTRPTRKRPRLRARDKLFWVVVRALRGDWRRHLALVRPESVIRWHRQAWRSRGPIGLGRPHPHHAHRPHLEAVLFSRARGAGQKWTGHQPGSSRVRGVYARFSAGEQAWSAPGTLSPRAAFKSAGSRRPAPRPLLMVAQHWRSPSAANQAIGQCHRVQRVREPPQPRGVIVGRCACPSRLPSLRSAPAAPLTAALRYPEAAAKRSGEVCAPRCSRMTQQRRRGAKLASSQCVSRR